jgi:hypothetical protein
VLPDDVIGPVRLALVVTFPAVKPEAVPVRLVATPEAGVPKAGVTKVGEVANTTLPDPVVVPHVLVPVPLPVNTVPLVGVLAPVPSLVSRATIAVV